MAFEKNNSEGGRKKGSKNKVTQETRELFHTLLENNLQKLQQKFDEIEEPEKFVKLTFELAQFCTPKLRSVEATTTNGYSSNGFSVKDVFKVEPPRIVFTNSEEHKREIQAISRALEDEY